MRHQLRLNQLLPALVDPLVRGVAVDEELCRYYVPSFAQMLARLTSFVRSIGDAETRQEVVHGRQQMHCGTSYFIGMRTDRMACGCQHPEQLRSTRFSSTPVRRRPSTARDHKFNAERCIRMNVPLTILQGKHDAVLQSIGAQGRHLALAGETTAVASAHSIASAPTLRGLLPRHAVAGSLRHFRHRESHWLHAQPSSREHTYARTAAPPHRY